MIFSRRRSFRFHPAGEPRMETTRLSSRARGRLKNRGGVNASRRTLWPVLLVGLLTLTFGWSSAAERRNILELGATNLDGEKKQPFADPNARAFVFVFVRTDCPIANAYAPELQRLHERFAARDTAFWLVYIDRDETASALRDHLHRFRLRIPALHDTTHSLVQFCAPQRTPEAVVFSRDFRKVYSGRIDDRFTAYGKQKERATKHDLADAIEATLDNRRVAESRVPAVGCPIVDLR
jgi:hypothetical protein